MSKLRELFKQVHIRGDMTPPVGAELTGRMHKRKPVYKEEVPVYETRQKVVGGDAQWHIMNGQKVAPVMERVQVGTKTEEYVLEDLGNGIVMKNRNFHEHEEPAAALTPEQQEIKRLEARVDEILALVTPDVLAKINAVEIDPDVDDLGLMPDDDSDDLGLRDESVDPPLQVRGTKGRGARKRKAESED